MKSFDAVLADTLMHAGVRLTAWQVRALDSLVGTHHPYTEQRAAEVLLTPSLDDAHRRALAWHRAQRVAAIRTGERRTTRSGSAPNSLLGLLERVLGAD